MLPVELTKERLNRLRKILDSKNHIFKEKHHLEYLVTPPKIIGRGKEIQRIFKTIYPKDGYLLPFVSVYGSSGTGKSTIVKFLCKGIDTVSFSFVNLRKARSNFECANLILTELDCKPVKHYAGISSAIDLIEKQIIKILNNDKKQYFILILDEFDEIFSDKRYSPSNFVFKLLYLVENLRDKGFQLCIAAISNSRISDYHLDERVKSRMDGYEIFFKPYTKEELMPILKDRAQKAFVSGVVGNDVLKRCAELSGDENGDCRRALQLLKTAGELAETDRINVNKVDVEKVNEASKKLEKDNLEYVLQTATLHQKILLLALSKCVLYTNKEEYSTIEIYDEYGVLTSSCDASNRLKIRRASELLSSLENTGIITSQVKSGGRSGNKKFYHLTMHCDMVGNLTFSRVWYNIKREQRETERFLEKLKADYQKSQKMLNSPRYI